MIADGLSRTFKYVDETIKNLLIGWGEFHTGQFNSSNKNLSDPFSNGWAWVLESHSKGIFELKLTSVGVLSIISITDH
jgi:hypothetical protein